MTEAAVSAPSFELAERGERLKAALIDNGILLIVFLPALVSSGALRMLCAAAFFGLLIYQCALLMRGGHTIGKRAMRIRIVRVANGANGGFLWNVLVRYLINGVLCRVPMYWLADSLLVFRQDRRCIHDFLAGTTVVREGASSAAEPASEPIPESSK